MTKVLLLSPYPEKLQSVLADETVIATDQPITPEIIQQTGIEHVISFGYRHILRPPVLDMVNSVINLHVSLLPWNRGTHPNFWSFFDDTPKGVTVHRIDAGLDTGPILAQQTLLFTEGKSTLAATYAKLMEAIVVLFAGTWPDIRDGRIMGLPQQGAGSSHRTKDLAPYWPMLPSGWDTGIEVVEALGRRHRYMQGG